jgi:hypothetical protein
VGTCAYAAAPYEKDSVRLTYVERDKVHIRWRTSASKAEITTAAHIRSYKTYKL